MVKSTIWQRLPDRFLGSLKAVAAKSGLDAITDHYMEFYIANLQKTRELEKEDARMNAKK